MVDDRTTAGSKSEATKSAEEQILDLTIELRVLREEIQSLDVRISDSDQEIGRLQAEMKHHQDSESLLLARNVLQKFAKLRLAPFIPEKAEITQAVMKKAYLDYLDKDPQDIVKEIEKIGLSKIEFVEEMCAVYSYCSSFVHTFREGLKLSPEVGNVTISLATKLNEKQASCIYIINRFV